MANKALPPMDEGFPTSRHVDGDNVKKVSDTPGYQDINRGHTDWTNSKTGERMERPDWASDRD